MNICFLTKYPPIEGGVSMRCYWLARGLAERGHTVVVATNAQEVEGDYRMRLTDDDREWYAPTFPRTGGKVVVQATTAPTERTHHIPFANPYVTKLSTIALRSIREYGCTSIFAYYLEPYGVAAYLASQWTDTPYAVRHAGSDLGRLMTDPDLMGAYREVFCRARFVCSRMREALLAMGVAPDHLWESRGFPIPEIFTPDAAPLDLAALARDVAADAARRVAAGGQPPLFVNERPLDLRVPTIGIYGKVGPTKGSYDLLEALNRLRKRGVPFNLVGLTQGKALGRFVELLRERQLQDRTWLLPFLPHWKVPGFIRACTSVCFLERDFAIGFHAPTVPREVLACGTSLVLSAEIAAKQTFASKVRPGENLFLVDPTQHDSLAAQLEAVVSDPARATRVGRAGHELFTHARSLSWSEAVAEWEQMLATTAERRPAEVRLASPPVAPSPVAPPLEAAPHGTAPSPQVPASAPAAEPPTAAANGARAETLASYLPLTRTALGDRWPALAQQYCRADRPAAGTAYEDAMQCIDFLRSIELSGAPAWLDDLLRYERAHNGLYIASEIERRSSEARALAVKAAAGGEGGASSAAAHVADPAFVTLVPRTDPGIQIESFAYDMTALCNALHRNDPRPEVAPAPTVILFKQDRNFVGQELLINQATRRLVENCNGTRTVQAVADAFFADSDDRDARDAGLVTREVTHAIRRLAAKGIVHLAPRVPAPEPELVSTNGKETYR